MLSSERAYIHIYIYIYIYVLSLKGAYIYTCSLWREHTYIHAPFGESIDVYIFSSESACRNKKKYIYIYIYMLSLGSIHI